MPWRIFFLFGLICGWNLLAFTQSKPIKPLSGTQIAARVNPSVCAVSIDCGNKDGMIGSGFCVGPNLVVTNKHVLGCSGTGQIHFEGKDPLPIKAVWVDPKQDLAILKVDLPKGIPLALAVGVKQARGEDIFVFGNPRGLENTISKGIISATRDEFVQFDAAISPGSSGGPVVDRFGQVIGVTTFFFKDGQNLNFAISAEKVRDLLNQIRSGRLGETALNRIPAPASPSQPHGPVAPPPPPKPFLPPSDPELRAVAIRFLANRNSETQALGAQMTRDLLSKNRLDPQLWQVLGEYYETLRQYDKALPFQAQAVSLGASITIPLAHHRKVMAGKSFRGTDNDLCNGQLVVSSQTLKFTYTAERSHTGIPLNQETFEIPLSGINEIKYEPNKSHRLSLTATLNTGKKVEKKPFNFYPVEARVESVPGGGFSWSATEIYCVRGDTTKQVAQLLEAVQSASFNRQLETEFAAAVTGVATPAPTLREFQIGMTLDQVLKIAKATPDQVSQMDEIGLQTFTILLQPQKSTDCIRLEFTFLGKELAEIVADYKIGMEWAGKSTEQMGSLFSEPLKLSGTWEHLEAGKVRLQSGGYRLVFDVSKSVNHHTPIEAGMLYQGTVTIGQASLPGQIAMRKEILRMRQAKANSEANSQKRSEFVP